MEFKTKEELKKTIDQLLSTANSLKKEYTATTLSQVKNILQSLHDQVDLKIRSLDRATVGPSTLKHYKIRTDFKDLFSNLGTGKEFPLKEAFKAPGKIEGKAYTNMAEAEYHTQVFEKLINCGFVEEVDTGIGYVPKGDE